MKAITAAGGDWIVHCPTKIHSVFGATSVVPNDCLDLTTSLRSHLAEDVQVWVQQTLDGNLDEASALAGVVGRQGFDMSYSQKTSLMQCGRLIWGSSMQEN